MLMLATGLTPFHSKCASRSHLSQVFTLLPVAPFITSRHPKGLYDVVKDPRELHDLQHDMHGDRF
jgi:hypothetical protein